MIQTTLDGFILLHEVAKRHCYNIDHSQGVLTAAEELLRGS
jgi:hypothetical protein